MSRSHAAGESFRRGYRRALIAGFVASVAVHATLALADPPFLVLSSPRIPSATEVVRLAPRATAYDPPPPAVDLPREEPVILRPARPVVLSGPVTSPPEVIPYDIPPRLENGEAITAMIQRRFPRGLELTETEPAVLLWLFVDRAGRVTKLQLARSSGYTPLDALAEQAAREMAFRPAIHAGKAVAVWVAQRIRFTRENDTAAQGRDSGASAGDSRLDRPATGLADRRVAPLAIRTRRP